MTDKPVIIYNASHAAVRTSRNLRGVLTHARLHGVTYASALPDVDEKSGRAALLYVEFSNGDVCRTPFASLSVCVGWIKARRSWGLSHFSTLNGWTVYKA